MKTEKKRNDEEQQEEEECERKKRISNIREIKLKVKIRRIEKDRVRDETMKAWTKGGYKQRAATG